MLHSALNKLLPVAFLLAASTLAIGLSKASLWLLTAFLIILTAFFFRGESAQAEQRAWWIFGLLVPLAPQAGGTTLLVLILIVIAFTHVNLKFPAVHPFLPFLLLVAIWSLALLFVEIDLDCTLPQCRRLFTTAPPSWHLALEAALRWISIFCLYAILESSQARRERMLSGLWTGLAIAVPLTLIQLLLLTLGTDVQLFFPNQISFWTDQRRISGTFSDPNAFGIFAALSLPLLVHHALSATNRWRSPRLAAAAGLFVLALFSGSRTFLACLAIYFLIWALRGRRRILMSITCLAGLAAALNFLPPALTSGALNALPSALGRAAQILQFQTAGEASFSRLVFWRIGWRIWRDHPLLGAGLERFRSLVVPYSSEMGFGTGIWNDNPNNLYLGILAELGLLGALCFAVIFIRLSWKKSSIVIQRAPLIALSILLIAGPHTYFNEVSAITALSLAMTVEVRQGGKRCTKWGVALVLCLAPLIVYRAMGSDYGFYAWEGPPPSFFRWTGRTAQGHERCGARGEALLSFRATNPDLHAAPLSVSIRTSGGEVQSFQIPDAATRTASLKCRNGTQSVQYRVTAGRTWSPYDFGLGGDGRRLGVQIQSARPEDTLQVVSKDRPE